MRSLAGFLSASRTGGATQPGGARNKKVTAVLLWVIFLFLLSAGSASAAESGPQWTLTSVARPTNLTPNAHGREDSYQVTLTNTGGTSTDGSPVEVTDELPEGLTLDPAGAAGENPLAQAVNGTGGAGFSCTLRTCTYTGVVVPDQTLTFTFPVDVAPHPPLSCEGELPATAAGCVTNVVRAGGGGADAAVVRTRTVVSGEPAPFGISPGGTSTALSSTQAGAHPNITTTVAFNTVNTEGATANDFKDITYSLPPGFSSDFVDTPACASAQFLLEECPVDTQIGVTTITLHGGLPGANIRPVYNLAPNAGEIAKLGFPILPGNIQIKAGISLRPDDYGANVTFRNTNQAASEVDEASTTIWGVPADPTHDALRWKPDGGGVPTGKFGVPSALNPVPFFTNPTSCTTGQLQSGFSATSWQEPEQHVTETMSYGPLVGCDRLGMEPSITAEATTSNASAASGLDVNVAIPQTYNDPEGLATSTLEKQVVTLPEGMTVNPSAGAGLAACTPGQYQEEAAEYIAGHGCPQQSKLGEVEIITPSLAEHAKGSVFLAQPAPFGEPGHNPFGSLLAIYIVARIQNRGVLVKAPGEVRADPVTGRLITTFDSSNGTAHNGLPPLPFSQFTFKFNQGAGAPLVTPPSCGLYTVTMELTPWSTLPGGVPSSEGLPLSPVIAPFPISSAFNGGACSPGGTPPFAPQVAAGTQNNAAGSYSPLDIKLSRNDGEQEITGFSSQLPPGLTANLTGVQQCSEAEIQAAKAQTGAEAEAAPACPAGSEIGHSTAEAGVGERLAQAPGRVYLGAPYQGAPFSIVSVTAAKVGPFDLGTVVVHLPLFISSETAAVTVGSGTANQIPHIIKGIVIHVRNVRVYVNRSNFTLNPTNCRPMSLSATVIGGGADPTNLADNDPVTVTDPFQAADCANLRFAPKFVVATSGRTSNRNGASLSVKLTYPSAPLGSQSNIARVKVELPRALPSRLTTLQKACTSAQFAANPAGCPAASVVGHARALTPILPVPLEGPAYFVSHGGESFPSLIVVLQGYGVTIDLVGSTFISQKGVTSSTFKTVPDQPVTSFELTLPQGRYSALGTNRNLCKVRSTLVMPTEFVGQNGVVIHQSTKIAVTGCPKAKQARKHKGHAKRGSKGKGKKK